MGNFGKTIRLFLVNGSVNDLITAELSNWTGIGVKVPKIKIKDNKSRSEFQKPGVYMLLGKGDDNDNAVYIGEAEVIYDRLVDHIANKEFWNEVIFFGSKDKYLNKASVKYLESRLYELAKDAGRYDLGQNIPTRPELSEPEVAELEEYLANIKVLTSTLGHKIFEHIEDTVESSNVNNQVLYCNNGAGANGKGSLSTEGFIVYKDSLFMIQEQQSLPNGIQDERRKMLIDGTLIRRDDNFYMLTKDYIFTSPSRAAAAILARSASGPLEWKTESGKQLKHIDI